MPVLFIQMVNFPEQINLNMKSMKIIKDVTFHHLFPKEVYQKSIKHKMDQFHEQPSLSHLQEIIQIYQCNTNSIFHQKLYLLIEQLDKIYAQGLQNLIMKELDSDLDPRKNTLQAFLKIGSLYYTLIHLKSFSLRQALFAKNQKKFDVKKLLETSDSIQQRQTPIYLIKKTYQIFGQNQELLVRIIDLLREEKKELLFQGLQFYHFVCNNEDSKYSYGKALIQQGRIEEGIRFLSQIEESSSIISLQSMEIIANNYKQLNMFGDSIKYYQKILQFDSLQTQFYTIATFQIGNILKTLYFLQQSLHFLQKSINVNKLRTPKQRNIGYKSIMDIGQIFESQNYPIPIQLIEVISNLPQITSRQKLQAYLCFVRSKIGDSNMNVIGDKLNKMLERQELSLELRHLAVDIYLFLGNYNKAQLLLEDNSQSFSNLITLSYTYLKQGRTQPGRINFQKAIINLYESIKNSYFLYLFNSYYQKEDIKNQISVQIQGNIKQVCDQYYQKGLEYKKQKRYFQALRQFKKIRMMDQKRNDYIMDVIEIFIFCQRFHDAFNLLEGIINNGQKNISVLEKIHYIYKVTYDNFIKKHILSKYPFITQRKPSQASMNECKQAKLFNFQIKLTKLNFNSFKVSPLWQMVKIKLAFHPKDLKQIDKILNKSYEQFYLDSYSLKILATMCIEKGINKYSQRFLSRALKIQPFDEQIIDLYIIYLEKKKDFSGNDLQSFKKHTSTIKLKNHIKVKIAQLYFSLKKIKQAIKIFLQIISLNPAYQFYSIFQRILKQLKYSEQDALLTILKYNNKFHDIHERLAFIYRLKKDDNLEIYHQQQIIKLFWNKQKALDRLVQLYKLADRDEEYIDSMKELSLLQTDNRELRLRLAEELRKRMRYCQQIVVLMRELKSRPLDTTIYQLISEAYQTYIRSNGFIEADYSLICILHVDERPLYYIQLSLYYMYFKQFKQSMTFFIMGVESIFFHQIIKQSSKSKQMLKDSLNKLQKQYGQNSNLDIIIKQAIFSKYSQKHEDYYYYVFKFERKKDHQLPSLQRCRTIVQELSLYSYWQKMYITQIIVDDEAK